jgi:hypothetical protein
MAKKAKRAAAKGASPARGETKRTRDLPLATVVAFVQWLEQHGHTKDFLKDFGKRKVALSALTFGRARSFVGQKQPGAKALAKGHLVTIPACPPGYRCF